MPKCSTFLMYGTLYNRFEPEWREFTKGRQYEKRGHYHAKINGDYIKVKGVDNPVSGCVGFGIERWILVFLAQYGTDSACWPDEVKKFIRQKG